MANELTQEEVDKMMAMCAGSSEEEATAHAKRWAEKTPPFFKATEATEEEVTALADILKMKEEEARRYNQMGKELEEKDLYDNAVKWYFKAAEMGNADAQVNLGCFYHFGHAVPQDYAKALEWFTKAAQQGDAGAQYLTANALYNNRGAPPNMTAEERRTAALYWYKKSAEGGDEGAKQELAQIESKE